MENPRPGRYPVLAVVGACGGAGASSLCALLAAGFDAAPGVLVDLDESGGGIDVLLGLDAQPGARWSDLRLGGGVLDPGALRARLPSSPSLRVLACDPRSSPGPRDVEQVIGAACVLGPVVLDVPRWLAPAGLAAVAGADAVLLLAPGEVRAAVAASMLLGRLRSTGTGVRTVLRPGVLPLRDLAAALGVDEALELPVDAWLGGDATGRLDVQAVPERLAAAARRMWAPALQACA